MSTPTISTLGFVGFGEAARALASGVRLVAPGQDIVAVDPSFHGGPTRTHLREKADELQVRVGDDAASLADCELILSLVTPVLALMVAEPYAVQHRPGQLYVDLNSTEPGAKRQVAKLFAPTGVDDVVDGVLTGAGIKISGPQIPISLSGPRAEDAARLLTDLGLNVGTVGDEVGAAAALKMIRGVVMKGLEALVVEALLAGEHYGVADAVIESVASTLDSASGGDLIMMLATTHLVHCRRRAGEAAMIEETVAEAGLEALMSHATRNFFDRSSSSGVDAEFQGVVPDHYRPGIAWLASRLAEPESGQ